MSDCRHYKTRWTSASRQKCLACGAWRYKDSKGKAAGRRWNESRVKSK